MVVAEVGAVQVVDAWVRKPCSESRLSRPSCRSHDLPTVTQIAAVFYIHPAGYGEEIIFVIAETVVGITGDIRRQRDIQGVPAPGALCGDVGADVEDGVALLSNSGKEDVIGPLSRQLHTGVQHEAAGPDAQRFVVLRMAETGFSPRPGIVVILGKQHTRPRENG